MKLAIMQPYFLPYIGYFQLMNAADTFVYYDDVTFIKQSWINRNKILLNDADYLFTLELKGASSFRAINKVEVGNNRKKLFKTFWQAYGDAPQFQRVAPLLTAIFNSKQNNLSKYIVETHKLITDHLGINTKFLISSEIDKNNLLKGQDKVIDICRTLGATKYFNSVGGQNLYSKSDFLNAGISLSFIQPRKTEYKQFDNEFIPWLSIIDILMFNSVSEIRKMLDNYDLL